MAEIMVMKTPAEQALANLFAITKPLLPGDLQVRDEAFHRFAERGLPHRRVEAWKYTDLRALMREAAPFAHRPTNVETVAALDRASAFTGVEAARIVIVNGHFLRELSELSGLPEGVEVVSLAEGLASHPLLTRMGAVEAARDNAAYALNSAFMSDGALIHVPAGVTVETPIHVRFVNAGETAFATATRVVLVAGTGASVTLFETHEGPDGIGYQPNDVVEVVAGDHARVVHARLNAEGGNALALSTLTAKLGAHVSFDTLNVVVGAGVSRHQVFLAFAGEGSRAGIRGATMIKGRQHADTMLVVDHGVPHGESRELFKTVVDDEATGVFQGKIIVQPHAQKTDGRMMSACVLLSEGGTMNNKPELEIFADDVQCAHGATCGQLDEDLLFYLMARGLPRKQAQALMIESFLGEAIEEGLAHEGARAALMAVVEGWLAARA